ncbi:YihY/virulence factor BrkB family protein [Kordiimonas aquimaris]|uniref:YihY/virulence factor BrkB family protein n=1 Tax=Kordiimonas aquimaris TaxID=707591 RepID=UPI0021D152E2|nr:YihY/virulence factor BrkB family protein [Kordiimonas aquimaris]
MIANADITNLVRHKLIWQRALRNFGRNNAMAAAGNMAFLTMLSLFPSIIFLVALSGFVGQTERGIEAINFMFEVLPPEVSGVIKAPIQGIIRNTGASILTSSILFALWTAAVGVEASRDVLIKAFGRRHARAMWIRRLESLAVVVIGAASVIAAMSILVIGPAILEAISTHAPEMVSSGFDQIWNYLRLLVSPLILLLGLYAVYFSLTPRRVKKPYRLPGTVFCLLVLISTAKGLSVYLKYVDNYDLTYGSLAGVVILQLFCFLVSIGFVMGAELNAAYTATDKQIARIERALKEDDQQNDDKTPTS